MHYNELVAILHSLTKREPTAGELRIAAGIKSSAMTNRKNRNGNFSLEELIKIAQYYNVEVSKLAKDKIKIDIPNVNTFSQAQKFEIKYCEELPDEYKTPSVTSKWEDIEIIENLWGRKKEDLRIIPMLGSSLEGYWYPIKNRDLLLIDTSITDLTKSGIFLFSTRNNTNLFIRELILQLDGSVLLRAYEPNGNREAKYTAEQLEELDFRVIGRVFKNINFTL